MTETTRPQRMHGRNPVLYEALKDAGIIRDGDYVRRVIIDICVEHAVVIYVERYGDERLLDLIRTMDGIEVRGVPSPAEGDEPSGEYLAYRRRLAAEERGG